MASQMLSFISVLRYHLQSLLLLLPLLLGCDSSVGRLVEKNGSES